MGGDGFVCSAPARLSLPLSEHQIPAEQGLPHAFHGSVPLGKGWQGPLPARPHPAGSTQRTMSGARHKGWVSELLFTTDVSPSQLHLLLPFVLQERGGSSTVSNPGMRTFACPQTGRKEAKQGFQSLPSPPCHSFSPPDSLRLAVSHFYRNCNNIILTAIWRANSKNPIKISAVWWDRKENFPPPAFQTVPEPNSVCQTSLFSLPADSKGTSHM